MERLNEQDQKGLISAVEQAIVLSRQTHPNDAILKVACDRQYSPEFVQRMVEAFNKSKTVHVLKEAKGDDRARPFDIADTAEILQRMYNPQIQKAAALQLPTGGRKDRVPLMQKAAALEPAPIQDPELRSRMMKHAEDAYVHVCRRVLDHLHVKVQEQKYAFDQALDRIVDEMAPMQEFQIQKVARYIINGYPTTGPGLLAVLSNRLSRHVPVLEKTANAVVFPNREPYLSISALYSAAEKMARAEVDKQIFQKTAEEGILSGIAGKAVTETLASMGVSPETIQDMATASKKGETDEVLDPAFYNRLRELDVRRAFLTLVLYDPDLKQYDFSDLRRAYNTAVSSAPSAYKNPVVLKNLMLRNLQSSGVKDPYELKQELDIGQALEEPEQTREKLRLEKAKTEALTKASPATRHPFEAAKESLPEVAEKNVKALTDWGASAFKEKKEEKKGP